MSNEVRVSEKTTWKERQFDLRTGVVHGSLDGETQIDSWRSRATAATGVVLIIWIAVEVALMGSPDGFPRFLQVTMTLLGVVILGLTMLPRVRAYTKLVD